MGSRVSRPGCKETIGAVGGEKRAGIAEGKTNFSWGREGDGVRGGGRGAVGAVEGLDNSGGLGGSGDPTRGPPQLSLGNPISDPRDSLLKGFPRETL